MEKKTSAQNKYDVNLVTPENPSCLSALPTLLTEIMRGCSEGMDPIERYILGRFMVFIS
jgi:hypothetical protein